MKIVVNARTLDELNIEIQEKEYIRSSFEESFDAEVLSEIVLSLPMRVPAAAASVAATLVSINKSLDELIKIVQKIRKIISSDESGDISVLVNDEIYITSEMDDDTINEKLEKLRNEMVGKATIR